MVDARLPDGSRVNATIPPLSLTGPLLTIRKFGKQRLDMERADRRTELAHARDRRSARALRQGAAQHPHLRRHRLGQDDACSTRCRPRSPRASGSSRSRTRPSCSLDQRHVLRLESRPKNIEGEGEITIRDLVRNSLRMRPDRIVVGEVRGAEALDMLQAMNTGPRRLALDPARQLAARRAGPPGDDGPDGRLTNCRCARSASRSPPPSTC